MIGLQDYETVLAVSRHKSWSGAAYATYQAPSTVSKRVKKVEDYLGSPLFNRAGKSQEVTLTAVGEAALPYIEQMCMLKRRIVAYAYDLQPSDEVEIRVGYAPLIGTMGESDVLSLFRKRNPEVRVVQVLRHKAELIKLLGEGRIDAAFVFAIGDADANWDIWERSSGMELEIVPLMRRDAIYVGMSASHPLAHRESVDISELYGETFVFNHIPRHLDSKRGYIRNLLKLASDEPIPVKVKTMDFIKRDAVISYIAQGYGVLPTACRPPQRYTTVRFVKVTGLSEASSGMFVCPKVRQSPILAKLLDVARFYAVHNVQEDGAPTERNDDGS